MPASRARRAARTARAVVAAAALVVAAGLAVGLGLGIGGAVPASAAVAQPATIVAQADGGSGPSPTGSPLPPKSQRIADSVIAVLLIVTLAGTLVAVATTSRWNRSRRASGPADEG